MKILICNQLQASSNFDLVSYMPILVACLAGGIALYNVKKNILLQYKVKQVELIRDSASKYFTLTTNLMVIAKNAIYNIRIETDPIKQKEISEFHYNEYFKVATEAANYENLIKFQLQKDNAIHGKVAELMETVTKELEDIRQGRSTDEGKLKSDLGKIGDSLVTIFEEKLGKDY